MRTCNRVQTNKVTSYIKESQPFRWVNDSHSHTAKSQHVVFFFMCRSTCSKCWKQAMALARLNDHLVANNTAVLLVGDGKYRRPAQRLIKELNLPFRYISDNGALRRYYHVEAGNRRRCEGALLFVDTHGIVRFSRFGCPGHVMRDFACFLKSITEVNSEAQEHIMRRLQEIGCLNVVKLVPQ